MIEFIEVQPEHIKRLAALASEIWHEYWGIILSSAQIDYMVENFQSENAIINQYKNEKYTYYFIKDSGKEVGYFGVSDRDGYLFLSKLYISKDFRSKGVGRKAFEQIKKLAAERKYNEIRLTVNKYNENTIQAYKKWGFVIVDSVVTDIGQGFVMDDYIMSFFNISTL